MSSNTNSAFCHRRTVLACLGTLALLAVASDASAAPLTDTELAEFNAGPAKYVVNSPFNTRIPQGATSPGFRVTMTRQTGGPLGPRIEVRTVGQVYVPPFAYSGPDECRPDVCPRGQRWQMVRRQFAGGFINVNRTDIMSAGATSILHRGINNPGAASVNLTLTFNPSSSPNTVLVSVAVLEADYGYAPPLTGRNPPPAIRHEDKPLGGPFVYAIQPAPANGGGA